MNKIKKIAIIILMIFVINIQAPYSCAGYWGETYGSLGMKQGLEEIFDQIKMAINSSVKMMSIKQATSTIEDLLYGGSSSPRNIGNFEDFIINDPMDKAVTYGEDFLTSALRGTTSGDYTSVGGMGAGLSQAIEDAGNSVIGDMSGKAKKVVNYQEHCADDNYFKCFSGVMLEDQNNPTGMGLLMQDVVSSKFESEQIKADLIAKSTGVLPAFDEMGNMKLPSSIVEEIQKQQITLPLEALANGDSNVFSSVIQSFAVTLIVGIVERGLGEVQESVGANMSSFSNQMSSSVNNMSSSLGPEFEYSGGSYDAGKQTQATSTWTNPDTGSTFGSDATASTWDNPDTAEDESTQGTSGSSTWDNPDTPEDESAA